MSVPSSQIPMASPQVKGKSKAIWLLVAAGAGVTACMVFLVAGIGVYYYKVAAPRANEAKIVGKWEDASGMIGLPGQPAFEFNEDGTGKMFSPDFGALMEKAGVERRLGLPVSTDMRWKIEADGKAPVFVMVLGKHWPEPSMKVKLDRMFFERNGDILTLGNNLKLKKMP